MRCAKPLLFPTALAGCFTSSINLFLVAAFKRVAASIGLLAIAALLQTPASGAEFEFMHLWRTESERQAMAVLQQAIEAEGLVWREHAVDGNFSGVRARFAEREALGRPPTASFWIGGGDLRKFVDDGLFRIIRDTPGRSKLYDVLVPEVRDMMSYGDGFTALPLGIHLQNFVVYNRSIFDRLSLGIPKNWQEFLDAAPALLKAGYTPLSMSDQTWQLRFLFTSILVEQMSHDELNGLLSEADNASGAVKQKLRQSLNIFSQLQPFANADSHDLAWEKVAQAVATDKAAAVVMGDFLTPLFEDDKRFVCGLAPGNKFLLWSVDVAVFPKLESSKSIAAQDVAIRAWAQPSVLDRYVGKKGGVPVIAQSNAKFTSVCAQQSANAWYSGVPRIPLVTSLWSNQLNRISSVAGEFWNGKIKSTDEVADLMLVALKSHWR